MFVVHDVPPYSGRSSPRSPAHAPAWRSPSCWLPSCSASTSYRSTTRRFILVEHAVDKLCLDEAAETSLRQDVRVLDHAHHTLLATAAPCAGACSRSQAGASRNRFASPRPTGITHGISSPTLRSPAGSRRPVRRSGRGQSNPHPFRQIQNTSPQNGRWLLARRAASHQACDCALTPAAWRLQQARRIGLAPAIPRDKNVQKDFRWSLITFMTFPHSRIGVAHGVHQRARGFPVLAHSWPQDRADRAGRRGLRAIFRARLPRVAAAYGATAVEDGPRRSVHTRTCRCIRHPVLRGHRRPGDRARARTVRVRQRRT